jgi:hypothetical protein
MKNVVPKTESEMENGASIYSNPCREVNKIPKVTVSSRDAFEFFRFPFIISWCAQVTVTPEDKRRIVFRRGILIGLKGVIGFGGQICPISGVGEILLCRKAQKNETKKRTSEEMNRIIPVFSPFVTVFVW